MLKFHLGEFDGGIICCEKCFNMICDNSPILLDKDPLYAHRKIKKTPGNLFGGRILIEKEQLEKFISGSNQARYSMKNMMLEHASCSTLRNGGVTHYKALVDEKKRNSLKATVKQVVCNQLKSALFFVKMKAASLHYENVIGFVHSCGADVANLGHGRNQLNAIIKAFHSYLNKKTCHLLTHRYHQPNYYHTLVQRWISQPLLTFPTMQ